MKTRREKKNKTKQNKNITQTFRHPTPLLVWLCFLSLIHLHSLYKVKRKTVLNGSCKSMSEGLTSNETHLQMFQNKEVIQLRGINILPVESNGFTTWGISVFAQPCHEICHFSTLQDTILLGTRTKLQMNLYCHYHWLPPESTSILGVRGL